MADGSVRMADFNKLLTEDIKKELKNQAGENNGLRITYQKDKTGNFAITEQIFAQGGAIYTSEKYATKGSSLDSLSLAKHIDMSRMINFDSLASSLQPGSYQFKDFLTQPAPVENTAESHLFDSEDSSIKNFQKAKPRYINAKQLNSLLTEKSLVAIQLKLRPQRTARKQNIRDGSTTVKVNDLLYFFSDGSLARQRLPKSISFIILDGDFGWGTELSNVTTDPVGYLSARKAPGISANSSSKRPLSQYMFLTRDSTSELAVLLYNIYSGNQTDVIKTTGFDSIDGLDEAIDLIEQINVIEDSNLINNITVWPIKI